jgi:hypothetical protein
LSGIGKKIADGGRKAAGRAAKASARAVGSAAKEGGKMAADKIPDSKTNAEWLVRVVTSLPKYLRLYFCLLTDNRVSSKAKVLLVTAVTALGAQLAFGGFFSSIQVFLSYILGPFAFIPTVIIVLLTLDFCYKLISADVLEEHERAIFGEEDSIESDFQHLRDFLGSSYTKIKSWWQKKVDRAEARMQEEGLIEEGELTDEAIQDVSDQIVELETSEELHKEIDRNVKLLQGRDTAASGALKTLKRKLSEE